MRATFGKLQNETIELSDGLNLIYAPNEAGKSTWCAFLSAMLYGFPSRERGPFADKNRYAPWNGQGMQGSLSCRYKGRDIVITRETARANSPMGRFSAVYAGTAEPVPDLSAAGCGETLLGVPREVFERSAFIRQSGMTIGQDTELERRITALITSGEEDTSYTTAYERLKKQLNRRRYNKTGLIPETEAALREKEEALLQLQALQEELKAQRSRLEVIARKEAEQKELLSLCRRWEEVERQKAVLQLQGEADNAQKQVEQLRSRLEQERIPTMEEIAKLRAAIVNLGTTRKSVEKAREERDDAQRVLYKAEMAAGDSPFASQTPEAAQKAAASIPVVRPKAYWLPIVLFGIAAGATFLLSRGTYPLWSLALMSCAGFAAGFLAMLRRYRSDQKKRSAYLEAYGAPSPEALQELAQTYSQLYAAREKAREEVSAKSAAAEALYASLTTNEQAVLIEVRRFRPQVFDLPAADAALRECVSRRRALSEAEAAAREAQLRCQLSQAEEPSAAPESLPPRPAQSPEEISRQLELLSQEAAAARSQADQIQGRLDALGDGDTLRACVESLRQDLKRLQQEYDAIAAAMEALSAANTTVQSRFSPELGRRAARIFAALTGGRYQELSLDRTFHALARAEGDTLPRDVKLLSQGTADQLYLSVRLAICDLLLPEEAPLILDDALITFDDSRMAAALDYLSGCGRQILLFTCQHREADYLRAKGAGRIQSLALEPASLSLS